MAYGLQIDNGSGKRVIDSENNGTYYLGRTTVAAGGATVSIPGYNSAISPLVFTKLNTTGYSAVNAIENATGTAPGGSTDFTVSIPSNLRYIYWVIEAGNEGRHATSGECTTQGGFFSGGICYRTADLDLAVDTSIFSGHNGGEKFGAFTSTSSATVGSTTSFSIDTLTSVTDGAFPEYGEAYLNCPGSCDPNDYGAGGDRFTWTSTSYAVGNPLIATLSGIKWWNVNGTENTTPGTVHASGTNGVSQAKTYQTGDATLSFNGTGGITGATLTNVSFGMNAAASADAPNSVTGANRLTMSDNFSTIFDSGDSHDVIGGQGSVGRQPSSSTHGPSSGWFPYDNVGSTWAYWDNIGYVTATANTLTQGWIVGVDTDVAVDIYVFGVGGEGFGTDTFGLELKNPAGTVGFSTRRPPANIADIQTISMNNVQYYTTTSNSSPAGGSGTVSGTLPHATTAVSLIPVLTPTTVRHQAVNVVYNPGACPVSGLQGNNAVYTKDFGLRYGTSGANIASLDIGASAETQNATNASGTNCVDHTSIDDSTYPIQPPAWAGTEDDASPILGIYSTTSNADAALNSGISNITQAWDLTGQVVFLDTTAYDRAEFDNLIF